MRKSLKYFSVLLLLLTFSSYRPADDSERYRLLMNVLYRSLTSVHYAIPNFDNDLSSTAFDSYIKRMDNSKRFLIKSDIEEFEKYRFRIDNEIQTGSFEFFDFSIDIFTKRIGEAEEYYKEILASPFKFNKNESIETDEEKLEFAESKKELKEYWRLLLKYQVLTKVENKLKVQENAKKKNDTSIVIKSFEEIEKEARKSVLKSHNNWFERLSKLRKDDHFNLYVNSIVNAIDPHTAYYPPKDKEDFDIRMSGQLEGIGATLYEKDGYITVSRIVPGSASWRQGELKSGDKILSVAQGNEKEVVDIVNMRVDDAVKLIRGKKGTKVRLNVMKIDGVTKEIPIIRDVVIIEETYAKSAIIENTEKNVRIGLINLPQFYVDFKKGDGGRRCADDIRKELIKLKKENIDGIVIDLRNNGGGSLPDVVEIAGMFIEKGPIVQVKGRWRSPYVLRDEDESVLYDGNLIVLVNSLSASASEIFASAMKDYNRAIIIGNNTFGKGTVQRFIGLDQHVTKPDDMKELGSLKLTIQKFYRINGKSTQMNGVKPDILLPDKYKYIKVGESELDNPLQWDEIEKSEYQVWDATYNIDKIVKKSKKRIESDSTFILIDERALKLKEQTDITSYSLKLKDYQEYRENLRNITKKYKNIQKVNPLIDVFSLSADKEIIEADSSKSARIEAWHKSLTKDRQVSEALNVIGDIK
ncbi:MAG: carboxy terminal-processing peptidase [Bacteroidota bacterium]|nr:carboxy terminal-processing peptidase [Bacteroidota bacterium]